MSKRTIFLFAAMGAALSLVACAPHAGLPTSSPPDEAKTPSESDESSAPVATPTESPSRVTYNISGTVFFDKDGDGERSEDEPTLAGIPIHAGVSTTAVSDTNGRFELGRLEAGECHLTIDSERFRYVALSPERVCTSSDVPLVISQTQEFNIPLMEGWMTLPFAEDADAWLSGHVDLDYNLGRVRNYADNASNTEDNHQGIDWLAEEGTPVLAVGPGVVIQEYATAPSGGIHLHIFHQYGDEAFLTHYGHLLASAVTLGQEVCRGEVVALSGKSGDTIPHLHLGLWEAPTTFNVQTQYTTILNYVYNNAAEVQYPSPGKMVPAVLDPYRDITDPESVSMWTVDNEPQYPSGQAGVAPESVKQAQFPQVLAEGDVAVSPSDGTTGVPVDTNITMSFKHAISDRADIESRFAVTPPGPGHFVWVDDHTLVFHRTYGLSYDCQYWVEFFPDWGSDYTVTFTTESRGSSPS